jgi:hypothetical protein
MNSGDPVPFDTQRLLFGERHPPRRVSLEVPEGYYSQGFTIIDEVGTPQCAVEEMERLIGSLDTSRILPLEGLIDRVRLAKADHIPVCDDVVSTAFQILHFDMGFPFLEAMSELLVTHVGIYLPVDTDHSVTARTRLLPLNGLFCELAQSSADLEDRLVNYVRRYGDGWGDTNTGRLACLARLLDAVTGKEELAGQRDKVVGQWFGTDQWLEPDVAHHLELNFFERHGVDIVAREIEVLLRPGQLLIVDNLRVAHGRIGTRRSKEICNLMYGVSDLNAAEVRNARRSLSDILATPVSVGTRLSTSKWVA